MESFIYRLDLIHPFSFLTSGYLKSKYDKGICISVYLYELWKRQCVLFKFFIGNLSCIVIDIQWCYIFLNTKAERYLWRRCYRSKIGAEIVSVFFYLQRY